MFRPKAITLIEVLISIAVFSVGILSISYLIISNVALSERTKLKTTATMLAKEGLELAFNRRDTNIKKGRLRNCLELEEATAGTCKTYFHNPDDLDGSTNWIIAVDNQQAADEVYSFVPASNNPVLNKKTNEQYGFTVLNTFQGGGAIVSDSDNSPFTRIVTFTPVYLAPENGPAHADKILKVTSTVHYQRRNGTYSGSVTLQSFMGDTLETIQLDEY